MILDTGISQEVADLLAMQLESWVWRYLYVIHRQRGLLQGNDASSLYANFYVHAHSRSEAKRILGELNRILRNKGLTINIAKTSILEGAEIIEEYFCFSIKEKIGCMRTAELLEEV